MSDIGTQDDPIFKGRTPGGISCSEFVRIVRKHAMIREKTRDNEYIADYAMSCLEEEALDWSETLSEDVRGDWSLLRPALLAEYRGKSGQTGPPLTAVIPNAMIPIPAAAPPVPPPSHFNAIAIAPAAPTTSVAPPSSPVVTDGTRTADLRRGRIRMTADSTSYYVVVADVPARCYATRDILKAATMELVDTDGGVELHFTRPSSSSSSWFGMIWEPRSVQIGSYAGTFPIERQGSTAVLPKGINGWWEGAVSVVRWTRAVDGTLTPMLDDGKGILVVMTEIPDKNGNHYLYVTNNLKKLNDGTGGNKPKEVQCFLEPL